MIWILDTSAWARREVPAVVQALGELMGDDEVEIVLSPPVLLELLRGPQGEAVAKENRRLQGSFRVLTTDEETFRLAAAAMEQMALESPEAHRLPVTDLVTSALAHQHDAGVLHFDGDYDAIAADSGLRFAVRRVCRPEDLTSAAHPVAADQRALKRQLFQLLHQRPVAEAESFLRQTVNELRRQVGADSWPDAGR